MSDCMVRIYRGTILLLHTGTVHSMAAPYRQEFIFSAYSVPCTSPQCLVWFKLWSSMAKQVLKSNVSGFISKFLTVISISLLACQCLDVKVQVPCHLHLTQTGSVGVCDP